VKEAHVGFDNDGLLMEVRQDSFKDRPFGGLHREERCCCIRCNRSPQERGEGVQEMHLLQIEHRTSVEHVAQTVMEEYL
jgi:hypothetical protein